MMSRTRRAACRRRCHAPRRNSLWTRAHPRPPSPQARRCRSPWSSWRRRRARTCTGTGGRADARAEAAVLDKYRIERLVGQGGFAHVYRATHLLLNMPVALKVLKGTLAEEVQPHGGRGFLHRGAQCHPHQPSQRGSRPRRHPRREAHLPGDGVDRGPEPRRCAQDHRQPAGQRRAQDRHLRVRGAQRQPSPSASSTATSSPATSCSPTTAP